MTTDERKLFGLAYGMLYNAEKALYEIEDEPNWVLTNRHIDRFFFLRALASSISKNGNNHGSDEALIETANGLMKMFKQKVNKFRMKPDESFSGAEKDETINIIVAIKGLCHTLMGNQKNPGAIE